MPASPGPRPRHGRARRERGRFYPSSALLGLLLLCGAASDESWFQYRGDGFAVRFPSEPRVQEEQLETPAGPQRVLVLNAVRPGESYAITCTFYAQALVEKAGDERLLAAAVQRFLRETDGSLIRERELDGIGYPGHEVSFLSLDSARVTTARLLFSEGRLFSLIADLPRSAGPDPRAERFFGSFEVERRADLDPGGA